MSPAQRSVESRTYRASSVMGRWDGEFDRLARVYTLLTAARAAVMQTGRRPMRLGGLAFSPRGMVSAYTHAYARLHLHPHIMSAR